MTPLRCSSLALVLLTSTIAASAPDAQVSMRASHAAPRLKASYRRFAIANLDGSSLWLDGAQLDAYPLSRRWVRLGIELGGGGAHASLAGNGAQLAYGLAGLSLGVQVPMRVTPFLDGRFAAGLLSGRLDSSTVTVGSASVTMPQSAALTALWGGGLETGVEVYTVGRAYLSAAIGWMRTTWRGLDVAAMAAGASASAASKDLTHDSFTLKVGLGI